ncbi:hypothetical protein JJQ72_15560 [Paenibacillus sp. F411]|uniref:Hydrolase n=1 Tax=Paenibacillus algicola TaxID=2565926 RepID=A0A4P8XFN0_9BACL|nr:MULTISPECIES: hypothetical protein [Paenibacillus]MBO2945393.1 hypothetical protein [Paenibacillus sp. F411]QCT01247.1 hypothetical protein E6C60_0524 [Paenibacillus algicola]
MSENKKYYISIAHNLIQEEPYDSNEFVVYVDDDQLVKLRDLMKDASGSDKHAFLRTFIPYKSADHDEAVEEHDDTVIALYSYIYRFGDETARKTIKDMNIIPKLVEDTGYDDPGYEGSPLNK